MSKYELCDKLVEWWKRYTKVYESDTEFRDETLAGIEGDLSLEKEAIKRAIEVECMNDIQKYQDMNKILDIIEQYEREEDEL